MRTRIYTCFSIVCCVACGGSEAKMAFHAAGHAEFESGIQMAALNISDISVSETGESWTHVGNYGQTVSLEPGSSTQLIIEDLPVGEYHGVKIEFDPGFQLDFDDSSTVTGDFPAVLMYYVNGIHRYSNAGNGFPDTVEYFMFTTRNGALSSEIDVEDEEQSFLVIELQPQYPLENGLGLSASIRYTSFLY